MPLKSSAAGKSRRAGRPLLARAALLLARLVGHRLVLEANAVRRRTAHLAKAVLFLAFGEREAEAMVLIDAVDDVEVVDLACNRALAVGDILGLGHFRTLLVGRPCRLSRGQPPRSFS